ncbi:hypothetical protein GCM10011591_24520 [Nocardia camponoti]|uniref:Uncharacterized protein n=1 Tax=Nocardia camponoti TaxID=1616106 RepID=A0A917QI62_9NOCA|nr:hypothetical protein GCM10011591_24520 [Nocardia camponoti]
MAVELGFGRARFFGDVAHAHIGAKRVERAKRRVDELGANLDSMFSPTLGSGVDAAALLVSGSGRASHAGDITGEWSDLGRQFTFCRFSKESGAHLTYSHILVS